MEQIKSITTTVVYATINASTCVLNIADNVIGKRKNADGDIVTSEAPVLALNLAYVLKQLIAANKGIASAVRRSGNAASTICAAIEGATIKIDISLRKAGETYDDAGSILEHDKYEYAVEIVKLDEEIIPYLKQARAKDFGL